MKEHLNKLPKDIQDLIFLIRDLASAHNIPVYLVGGFVRDLILGVHNFDLDIVIEGDGIRFAEDLANSLQAKLTRHKRFGTATVSQGRSLKIDIATARKETYPHPSALPLVSGGELIDDLRRRDFTINALAISLNHKDFGNLIDYYCGKKDLIEKKIRILHDLSFIDDPTRMLRAIRFAVRYGFCIESHTLGCLKEAVRLKMLQKVKPQRLRQELIFILQEERPLRYIRQIQKLLGWEFLNPRLTLRQPSYDFLHAIEKQNNWFKHAFPQLRHIDTWLTYLAGIIDKLDFRAVRAICKKFSLRRGDEKRMLAYKSITPRLIHKLSRAEIKPSEIWALLDPLSYEAIILLRAKHKQHNLHKHSADFLRIYNGVRIRVSGDDLHRLGFPPGPAYQKIFSRLLNAKLDGLIRTKEEEWKLLGRLISNPPPRHGHRDIEVRYRHR